jgi:predicted LPLAT superfamily acyltransferase
LARCSGAERMPESWNGRSRGGRWGTALVTLFARWGGRDLCYLFVIPPAIWFWLTDRPARRAIMSYWQLQRPGWSWLRRAGRSLLHFWMFARALADRLLLSLAPDSLRFIHLNLAAMEAAMRHPQGCILLSAHIGSFELSARMLSRDRTGPRLNLVMLDAEDPRVQSQLSRVMEARPYGVIDLRDPAGAALAIAAALSRGETCCMLGDRTAGDPGATVPVTVLGQPTRLPTGPFIAAAVTGALVVPTFCCRSGWRTWTCEADPAWTIELGPRAGRRERLAEVVQRWADRLTVQTQRYPDQWNNYFAFWG